MGLIKMPSELQAKATISILIYGEPGIGKTTLGVSAPNAVLFDYDGGVQRINGAHRVPTLQVSSWEETNVALEEIKAALPSTQSIVIDTVGKMLDFMSQSIIRQDARLAKRDGSLSLQGYGVRKSMFIDFIRRVSLLGYNLIFIAHEREDKRGEEYIKRPEIGGSSANDLIKELDLVGYMHAVGKKRVISFTPEEHWYGKNTCNLPAEMEVTALDTNKQNNYLCGIIDTFVKVQQDNIAVSGEYDKLIAQATQRIADISNADDANDFIEYMNGVKHVFNSKVVLRAAFAKRVKELELAYNKEEKRYED